MDSRRPIPAHKAEPVSETGPAGAAYSGAPGQTRHENVHLVEPDGSVRSVAVCRVVNARTHPELRARALSGLLHRLDDGRELALPFVYHDPEARKLALVIPPMLAHLELKEWSRLMGEIADDTQSAVPPYVKSCTTVVGIAALVRFLEAGAADAAPVRSHSAVVAQGAVLHEREALLAQRERELAEQERGLIRMAEGLTAREGTLLRREEQLETARVDLEIREAELSSQRPSVPSARSGGWQEVGRGGQQNEATVVANFTRELAANAALVQDHAEAQLTAAGHDRHAPPPLPPRGRNSHSVAPPPLPGHRPRATPPPLVTRRDHEELTVIARGHAPPPLPGHAEITDADNLAEPAPEPEVAPPTYFESRHPGQMALKLDEDELWLFVQLDAEHRTAFHRGAELMLQYAETEGYPVVVLSLVDQGADEPYAIRLALDGRAEADLRVLEHLCRSFRARVALHVEGSYTETVTVSTLRESVAQAICDKIDGLPRDHHGGPSPAEALVAVLHSPPPLWNDDLPFGPARRETPTPAAVQAAVEQLSSWMRPELLTAATLTYSVPRHVVEASLRRVLRSAVVFGVSLPSELVELAVEHGVASDERALLRDQLQAFRQRVEQNENDMSDEATRRNWEALFARAERLDVAVDDAVLALAESASSAAISVNALGSERPFEALGAAELRARVQEPSAERVEAIKELCTRGHPSAIEAIVAVLDTLAPTEAAVAIAQLTTFGEAVGDDLVAALSSPHAHIRQCAALGLGRLRLRRALAPLLKQLETEEAEVAAEVARAFGDFGMGALRAVARVIPGSEHHERLSAVLAHLANHGSAKEVERLENDPDAEVALVARRAMARRSRMEWEDLAVRKQRTLSEPTEAARLSQLFFAEAPKADI